MNKAPNKEDYSKIFTRPKLKNYFWKTVLVITTEKSIFLKNLFAPKHHTHQRTEIERLVQEISSPSSKA